MATYSVDNTNDSGAGSLRLAITQAEANPGADTIIFSLPPGSTIALTGGEIDITDDLTIEGDGTTIDAQTLSPIFDIEGPFGDPIAVSIEGLVLANADFDGADYGDYGGAINAVSSNTTITGSRFENNYGYFGGAIDTSSGGGGDLVLVDTDFEGNQAAAQGGAIFFGNDVTITGGSFTNNAAGGVGGGALYGDLVGLLTIHGTYFGNNFDTAVIASDVDLDITNATFTQNQGFTGGAINVSGGNAVIGGSLFLQNTATMSGGAIAGPSPGEFYDPGSIVIVGSTFDGNEATYGGAVRTLQGPTTITASTFSNNAADFGGAIFASADRTDILDSAIYGNNAAVEGAGIWAEAPLTLINSTVYGNGADSPFLQYGGGITLAATADASIINSTIVGNGYADTGGGISNVFGAAGLVIDNSIIALNQGFIGPDVAGPITASNGANIFGTNVSTPNAGDIQNASAVALALGPLADNGGPTQTVALLEGSIAINGGINVDALDADGGPLTTDQRGAGFERIEEGTVDVGAFEFDSGGDMLQVFPELVEGQPVDPGLVNGVPPDLLVGDGVSEITVRFDSETAAFENSLGYYRLDSSGGFAEIDLLFANTDDTILTPPGAEISLGVLDDDERFGFFLVKKGFTLNTLIQSEGVDLPGTLRFIDPVTWQPGNVDDPNPLRLYLDEGNGSITKIKGPILHAANYSGEPSSNPLNPNGAVQSLSGQDESGVLKVGFEDNPVGVSPSDRDYNDVTFSILFDPPPSAMTTDGSSYLV